MQRQAEKKMFAMIKGKKIKINTAMTINTGNKDRQVKLVEQHKKALSKICVLYHNKKSLVPKSSVKIESISKSRILS